MSQIHLHKANLADLDALVELEYAACPGERISARSWRDLLATPAAHVIAAMRHGELLGSAVMLTNARTAVARLYSLAVRPDARRLGIARTLIEHALDRADQRDALVFQLETPIDNLPAQALFESMGFSRLGRTSSPDQDGVAAIRYERAVAQAIRT